MTEKKEDCLFFVAHSAQLLMENLNHLMEKNQKRIDAYRWHKVRYPTLLVSAIFEICDRFEKNRFVKYTAVEILIRYLTNYYSQLEKCLTRDEIVASINGSKENKYLWIFMSIRLADKLHSMHEHVTTKEVIKALAEFGVHVTTEKVNMLERVMLKTLKFDVSFVIVPEYMEVLLLSLALIYDVSAETVKNLKLVSLALLDAIYPHIEALYQQMCECMPKENPTFEIKKEDYYKLRSNYFNLALGTIVAAAHKVSSAVGAEVLGYLCILTGSDEKEMAFYAMNIIHLCSLVEK